MVIDGHLKLSPDFGWRSRTRCIYDAPEAGVGHLAPAADIWSLGIVLVEALTQQPPAWDRSQGGEPEVAATIPEPFFTIARECLQVDPARRCTLAGIKAHLNPP
jgi:serine/threonine protein kinase